MKRMSMDKLQKGWGVSNALSILLLSILSGVVGMIFVYAAKYKGALLDKSIILYIFTQLVLQFGTIIFFFATFFYAVKGYKKTKQFAFGIPCIMILGAVLAARLFFGEINEEQFNFNVYMDERREVIQNIESRNWVTNELGEIELPPEYEKQAAEGMGYAYVVHTRKGSGIYFMASPGLMGESSGYIFLTDYIPKENQYSTYNITLFEECGSNWYRCSANW